jgi:phage shock protein E
MISTYWTLYFLALGGLIAFMIFRRWGQIPKKEASDLIRQGALVVDVRNPDKFNSGHLAQAFNMPVDEIEDRMAEKVKDRSRVILVHCQNGLRSKKAKEKLTRIGYKNVFDLGSYERAFSVVTGRTM